MVLAILAKTLNVVSLTHQMEEDFGGFSLLINNSIDCLSAAAKS